MSVNLTIADAADALRAGTTSAQQLLDGCIRRANAHDEVIGSFIARDDAAARSAAELADAQLAAGIDLGPLHGIPVAVKDIVATSDLPTTAQSLALPPDWVQAVDAPVVARLRAAGAVIVGKTTTMEFAIGMPDRSGPFPLPRNPWDLTRWSGGSSSGTANGIAAGFFLGGVGTDTGGSIRLPAAFCGVTGLKPTHGLIPVAGVIPLAPSLDAVGPLARTALDCLRLLEVMAARGARSPTRVRGMRGVRIAIERAHLETSGVEPGAAAAFETASRVLRDRGAHLADVEFPKYAATAAASQIILLREALAVHRENLRRNWRRYGRHTRRRLAHGTFFTDRDLERARRAVADARAATDRLFRDHDVIMTLTAGAGSESLGRLDLDRHIVASVVAFTRIWNPVGVPAVSVPIGFTDGSVPVGMQLVARPGADAFLLDVAAQYQQVTRWHHIEPTLLSEEL